MSPTSSNLISFPSPHPASFNREQALAQIRESVNCIAAALIRSQRKLQEITKIVDELENEDAHLTSGTAQASPAMGRDVGPVNVKTGEGRMAKAPKLLMFDKTAMNSRSSIAE